MKSRKMRWAEHVTHMGEIRHFSKFWSEESLYREWSLGKQVYSVNKITPSLSHVTVRKEGKLERARGSKTTKSMSKNV
jgi:hypothetical protein